MADVTDDMAQWLGEQIKEDERITRAASWGDGEDAWHAKSSLYDTRGKVERWYVEDAMDEGVVTHVDPQAAQDGGVARHIAEWDPARVLREIDAKRQIMQVHNARDSWGMCVACPRDERGAMQVEIENCPILRALALSYADRPGYRENWRP